MSVCQLRLWEIVSFTAAILDRDLICLLPIPLIDFYKSLLFVPVFFTYDVYYVMFLDLMRILMKRILMFNSKLRNLKGKNIFRGLQFWM